MSCPYCGSEGCDGSCEYGTDSPKEKDDGSHPYQPGNMDDDE